jgi:hypothetical protein
MAEVLAEVGEERGLIANEEVQEEQVVEAHHLQEADEHSVRRELRQKQLQRLRVHLITEPCLQAAPHACTHTHTHNAEALRHEFERVGRGTRLTYAGFWATVSWMVRRWCMASIMVSSCDDINSKKAVVIPPRGISPGKPTSTPR